MGRWQLFAKVWLALNLLLASAAQAAEVSADVTQQVQQVIRAQLAAFAADDAEAAFAQAGPAIRDSFGSAERFIGMVRQGYPMVYRPASVAFMAAVDADGDVLQGVRIVDAAGRAWDVVYQLHRGGDGRWRIAGCHAEPSRGLTT